MCDCFDLPPQQQHAVITVPFSSDVGGFRQSLLKHWSKVGELCVGELVGERTIQLQKLNYGLLDYISCFKTLPKSYYIYMYI